MPDYPRYFSRRRVLRMTHYFFQRKYFTRFFLIPLFTVLAGSYSSGQIRFQSPRSATPPIASYSMSDGMDASGNSHTLALSNTSTVPGKHGSGQQFNGISSRASVNGIQPTTAFTLEAWVNIIPVPNNRAVPRLNNIPRVGPRATPAWQALIYKGLDNFFINTAGDFLMGGVTTTSGLKQVTSPNVLQYNSWHHYALTFTGANLYLFIDGVIVASQGNVTGTVVTSSAPVELGGSQTDGGYLNGIIDDVRIYPVALTAPEILTDMATPVDVPREPVISWLIEVWRAGTVPSDQNAVTLATFNKDIATCNLIPLNPPPVNVVNPDTFRVSDPDVVGRECEVMATQFFNSVPLGTGYFSTAIANGATTQSERSVMSNTFDRTASATPPNTPTKPGVIDK